MPLTFVGILAGGDDGTLLTGRGVVTVMCDAPWRGGAPSDGSWDVRFVALVLWYCGSGIVVLELDLGYEIMGLWGSGAMGL